MKHKKITLPNGLRIILVPQKSSPAVTVLVMTETGSKYETEKEGGISHFLEHMVFKGTSRRPDASMISEELDSVGSHYNAFTSHEYTGYYAKVSPEHALQALDIVSDMYQNPLLKESEIKKESGVIVEEIRMYQDMPQRYIGDLFMTLMYGDSPAGRPITGTEQSVKSFTKKDFENYIKKHYVASSTIVAVAGNFDEKEMQTSIEEKFKDIRIGEKGSKEKVVEDQKKPAILLHKKDTDQTHLILGVRSYPITDEREPILRVMSTVLGRGMSSRLFKKLRDEMGVCYYVRSESDTYTDHGIFAISAGVDQSRVEEVVGVLMDELKRLKKELVGDAELKKAKDYMNGSMMLGLETSDSQAEFYTFQETLMGKMLDPKEAIDEVNAVTSEDIKKVANEIFVDNNINLALIGKYSDEEKLRSMLSF